jgi:hypothetical protein
MIIINFENGIIDGNGNFDLRPINGKLKLKLKAIRIKLRFTYFN